MTLAQRYTQSDTPLIGKQSVAAAHLQATAYAADLLFGGGRPPGGEGAFASLPPGPPSPEFPMGRISAHPPDPGTGRNRSGSKNL